jgi:hypothetical protein
MFCDYKFISKRFSELIYTESFTVSAKQNGPRYLVFAYVICVVEMAGRGWPAVKREASLGSRYFLRGRYP